MPEMNVIDELKARLSRYPEVDFTESEGLVEIHAVDEGGFPITVEVEKSSYNVYFEGWHESFQDAGEARFM